MMQLFVTQAPRRPSVLDDAPEWASAPRAELQPSKLRTPCDTCRERWARGEPALPTHPCCAAHLP